MTNLGQFNITPKDASIGILAAIKAQIVVAITSAALNDLATELGGVAQAGHWLIDVTTAADWPSSSIPRLILV